jgi:hypothetical protein
LPVRRIHNDHCREVEGKRARLPSTHDHSRAGWNSCAAHHGDDCARDLPDAGTHTGRHGERGCCNGINTAGATLALPSRNLGLERAKAGAIKFRVETVRNVAGGLFGVRLLVFGVLIGRAVNGLQLGE